MDSFILGWIMAIVATAIGYGMGLIHSQMWKHEHDEEDDDRPGSNYTALTYTGIPMVKDEEPKPDLGAVNRPAVEDIEKRERPVLKEEEEAWEEDIKHIV